jgi:hypothetical protein
VAPVIIRSTGTISKPFIKYLNNMCHTNRTSRNHRKQPHWALHTYFGKYYVPYIAIIK